MLVTKDNISNNYQIHNLIKNIFPKNISETNKLIYS